MEASLAPTPAQEAVPAPLGLRLSRVMGLAESWAGCLRGAGGPVAGQVRGLAQGGHLPSVVVYGPLVTEKLR